MMAAIYQSPNSMAHHQNFNLSITNTIIFFFHCFSQAPLISWKMSKTFDLMIKRLANIIETFDLLKKNFWSPGRSFDLLKNVTFDLLKSDLIIISRIWWYLNCFSNFNIWWSLRYGDKPINLLVNKI
jgi:hypothetical protein